jgi:hypothetical protein
MTAALRIAARPIQRKAIPEWFNNEASSQMRNDVGSGEIRILN